MKTIIAIMALAAFASLATDRAEAADANRASLVSTDVSPAQGPMARDVPCHYQVLYHHGHHWYVYRTYETYHAAHHAADELRCQGYHTRIRAV